MLDDDGPFKTALEGFKNFQNAEGNPLQTQKIAELEGELAKFRQELAVKNQRILELESALQKLHLQTAAAAREQGSSALAAGGFVRA